MRLCSGHLFIHTARATLSPQKTKKHIAFKYQKSPLTFRTYLHCNAFSISILFTDYNMFFYYVQSGLENCHSITANKNHTKLALRLRYTYHNQSFTTSTLQNNRLNNRITVKFYFINCSRNYRVHNSEPLLIVNPIIIFIVCASPEL